MLVRVPDYYDQFRCLAGACPHSCCTQWEVVIDEDTAARYAAVEGELGDRLRAALTPDGDGDLCFPLNGGRCPFLDGENLCEIHRRLGEDATSITCREHPRFTEDYGAFCEVSLAASCPAANDLLLGSSEPLRFVERENGLPAEEGDEWLPFLLPLRQRMLDLLCDRRLPLHRRLADLLLLAWDAQLLLDEDRAEELPRLAETWRSETAASAVLPEAALPLLAQLEPLEQDWHAVLAAAGYAGSVTVPEELLERIAACFTFRYLLKTVNDGDLLSRVQLVAFAVLTVERIAAVCGLGEALRRFSCEIEHSEENLQALSEAFRSDVSLSAQAFIRVP